MDSRRRLVSPFAPHRALVVRRPPALELADAARGTGSVGDAARVEVLTAWPNPFVRVRRVEVTDGMTLASLVARETAWPARVFLERRDKLYGPIAREQWHRIRPKPGTTVIVQVAPLGSGDGGSDNKTTRAVLQVVIVLIAAVATAWIGGIGGGLVGLAISVGGQYALNQLIPAQMPKLRRLSAGGGGASEAQSPTLSIVGSNNRANPYGPIPKIYGAHRMFPPRA